MSRTKYLFDTNIAIELFRRNPKVIRLLESLNSGQATFSVLSYLEFVRGEVKARRTRNSEVLTDTLALFSLEAFTPEMAKGAGAIALRLGREDMNDVGIAFTALKLKRTLVTLNIRDFQGFPGLRVSTVDDLLE